MSAQLTSPSSTEEIKTLLADANKTLQEGNTTKTMQNLLMVQRIITQNNENSSAVQDATLLIRETVEALVNNRPDLAATNLNLINKQLFIESPRNITSDIGTKPEPDLNTPVQSSLPNNTLSMTNNGTSITITKPLENTIPTIQSTLSSNETIKTVDNATTLGFRTYENRVFGIEIQYPESWSARGYSYNKAANNTVVGFYSPSKTSSQLGNISGVSGQFIPYLDIFVFDSKNLSLNKIVDGRMNRIQNTTTDIVIESKPISLKGNHPAHMLVYSTITGGDEFFKKMQVYTISNNKVYLITYTAQEALFSEYLPVVQKMIDSFEI